MSEFPTSFLIVKNFSLIYYVAYVFCISDKLGSLTLAQFAAKYLSRFHDNDCYLLFAGMVRSCTTTAYRAQRYTAYRTTISYYSYGCGWWRRCTGTRHKYVITYRSFKRASIQLLATVCHPSRTYRWERFILHENVRYSRLCFAWVAYSIAKVLWYRFSSDAKSTQATWTVCYCALHVETHASWKRLRRVADRQFVQDFQRRYFKCIKQKP